MLENVAKITRVVLACGTVDLRKGIDGLSMIIGDKYKQNPFEKGTLPVLWQALRQNQRAALDGRWISSAV